MSTAASLTGELTAVLDENDRLHAGWSACCCASTASSPMTALHAPPECPQPPVDPLFVAGEDGLAMPDAESLFV